MTITHPRAGLTLAPTEPTAMFSVHPLLRGMSGSNPNGRILVAFEWGDADPSGTSESIVPEEIETADDVVNLNKNWSGMRKRERNGVVLTGRPSIGVPTQPDLMKGAWRPPNKGAFKCRCRLAGISFLGSGQLIQNEPTAEPSAMTAASATRAPMMPTITMSR